MTYKTTFIVWSAIGCTPNTGRTGAVCDELLRVTLDCETPELAMQKIKQLVKETEYGYSGHYSMPDHPNQNMRSNFSF